MDTLRITEIFYSLQGESNTVGWPTVFIRLTGCPLRCQYCDTDYAFHGGKKQTIVQILEQVAHYNSSYVTVTGGEPLAQKACLKLLTELCNQGYNVSLETSGSINIVEVDSRVVKVVDVKTPGSGEVQKNFWDNLYLLSARDQVKFVLCDRSDYDWAKQVIDQYQLIQKVQVLFSPSYEQLSVIELAEWILADRLCVRFQMQLHKYIWGNIPGK